MNAVHVLYYNAKAELGNDLVGSVRRLALHLMCWAGIMHARGRLRVVAPDQAIDGPASGPLCQTV